MRRDLTEAFDLVVAGGGLAAQRCCERLRRGGYEGRIAMICEEPTPPYDRPPLSKAVLTGHGAEKSLRFRPDEWYATQQVELLLETRAVGLDPHSRTIVLRHAGPGAESPAPAGRLRYGRLLIATGSRPRRLPGLEPGGPVVELRSAADAARLREALRAGPRLLVVGAGLVGMEVASAARSMGLETTMVEAAPTPLARALPAELGRWLARMHASAGVEVKLATTIERIACSGELVRALLSDGTTVEADTVLVGAGSVAATGWIGGAASPDTPLATDAEGRTAYPDVYAAGDAASFPDPFTGSHLPTPHWEAAARQGILVAHSILGTPPPAPVPAMFWSDQHGRRLQMVGHLPREGTIELDGEPRSDAPFAVWISCGGRPAAALLVDRPEEMARARSWVAAAGPQPVAELPRRSPPPPERQEHGDGIATGDRRVGLPRTRRLRRAGA